MLRDESFCHGYKPSILLVFIVRVSRLLLLIKKTFR